MLVTYPEDHPKIGSKAKEMDKGCNVCRQVACAPSCQSYSATDSSKPDLCDSSGSSEVCTRVVCVCLLTGRDPHLDHIEPF